MAVKGLNMGVLLLNDITADTGNHHPLVFSSVHPSARLTVRRPVCPSVRPSAGPFIHPPFRVLALSYPGPSICRSFCPPNLPSAALLSVDLSIRRPLRSGPFHPLVLHQPALPSASSSICRPFRSVALPSASSSVRWPFRLPAQRARSADRPLARPSVPLPFHPFAHSLDLLYTLEACE